MSSTDSKSVSGGITPHESRIVDGVRTIGRRGTDIGDDYSSGRQTVTVQMSAKGNMISIRYDSRVATRRQETITKNRGKYQCATSGD